MLDAPVRLRCGVTAPSRIALAPLTNVQSNPDGTLHAHEHAWLTARAGFGWVSTCAAFVSEEGKAWNGQLGIAHDRHLPGLERLAAGLVRKDGSRPFRFVQLHHAGAKADQAPLRISADQPDETGRAATIDDLSRVVADFVLAAERAQRAGFDGVEIHGANGYLFTQFLAPADNHRDDAFGGPLENRARLLRHTVRAVRARLPADFAVGVRFSPVDTWAPRGLVLEQSVQVGQWLAEDGIDFLHLSLRDAAGPAPFEPDGPLVSRAFRDALPGEVVLTSAGGIWTRDDAQRALDAGADVAVLGRAAIAHADWPTVSRGADWQPTRPPWTREHLRAQHVSDPFVSYLARFDGLVEGGRPAR